MISVIIKNILPNENDQVYIILTYSTYSLGASKIESKIILLFAPIAATILSRLLLVGVFY